MTVRCQDTVRFHRPAFLPGVELVSATYGPRSFPMHAHPEYVIGAIVQGAETLAFADARFLLPEGSTLFIRPDEVHANEGVGPEPFGYRVIYADRERFRSALKGTRADGDGDPVMFANHVSQSRRLYRHVLRCHRGLIEAVDALEQQSLFVELVGGLARHGLASNARPPAGAGLAAARQRIDDDFREPVSLDTLAQVAGLSTFHFLRAFKGAYGQTPVAYRTQRRISEASRLLRAAVPLAEVAAITGFADQAHLSRQFQRYMGISPGRYAAQ